MHLPRIRKKFPRLGGFGGDLWGLLREQVLDLVSAAWVERSTNFVQKGESAEQDAERNPEVNVGCDGAKEVAGGAISRF